MPYKIIDLELYDGLTNKALFELSDNGNGSYRTNGALIRKNTTGGFYSFPLKQGAIYGTVPIGNGSANAFPPQNAITMQLITFDQPVACSSFSINVIGAAASSLMKIVVAVFDPNTDLVEVIGNSPDLSCSTTGVKTWTPGSPINFNDPYKIYAVGVIPSVSTINTTGVATSAIPTLWNTSVGVSAVNGIQFSPGSYTVPSSFTSAANTLAAMTQVYMTLNTI